MNIELDNVSKNFKNQTVLENVNLKLESGKIYGLVGRNGSGKSVLLKIMTGLMEPSDGIIKYGGIPLKKGQYAKDVGIVLDCIGFMPEYTAKENLLLLAKINKKTGEERINEILRTTPHLSASLEEIKDYYERNLDNKDRKSVV